MSVIVVAFVQWVVVSSQYNDLVFVGVYLCLGDLNEQSIYDQRQEFKSIVIGMLQNLSQMYSSHNNNIKCIGFESFHYFINLNVVSSFMIFNGFDYMFLSMYC